MNMILSGNVLTPSLQIPALLCYCRFLCTYCYTMLWYIPRCFCRKVSPSFFRIYRHFTLLWTSRLFFIWNLCFYSQINFSTLKVGFFFCCTVFLNVPIGDISLEAAFALPCIWSYIIICHFNSWAKVIILGFINTTVACVSSFHLRKYCQ